MAVRGTGGLQESRGRADKERVASYVPNPSLRAFRGTVGGLSFRRDGTVLPLARQRDPRTPLQLDARARMKLASEAWATLTPEEARSWRGYAELVASVGETSEGGRLLRAYDLFCGLACKRLQITEGLLFERTAPGRLFSGDALVVEAEPGPGVVRFEANGPNGPFALTELLLQPLKNANRQPQPDRYRTEAFVRFEPGALVAEIEAAPGAYAAATRTVLEPTGQASRLVALGVVVVSASQ